MQAARGTPLSPPGPAATVGSGGQVLRLRLLFLGIAAAAYAVDVATKVLAVHRLSDRPDVRVLGDLFTLHLTRNPGAAFGTATEYTVVLSVVAIGAVTVVLWLSRRLGSRWWAVGLGLLLAGVAGNLTDRLLREPGPLRGHVVDFLRVPNFPVFNFADVFINVAAGIIVLQAIRGVRIDGSRERPSAQNPGDGQREPA